MYRYGMVWKGKIGMGGKKVRGGQEGDEWEGRKEKKKEKKSK